MTAVIDPSALVIRATNPVPPPVNSIKGTEVHSPDRTGGSAYCCRTAGSLVNIPVCCDTNCNGVELSNSRELLMLQTKYK